MAVKTHVQNFLLATDPPSGLRRMAELTVETLKSDARARKSLASYLEWVRNPPLSKRARTQFDKTGRLRVPPVVSGDPAESTLLAASFLWMQRTLPSVESQEAFFARLPKVLRTSDKFLGRLEPDFLGELLVQTEARAAENSSFARRLDGAARSLDQELKGMNDLARQAAPLLESTKKSMPASKRSGGGGVARINKEDILQVVTLVLYAGLLFGLGFSVGTKNPDE